MEEKFHQITVKDFTFNILVNEMFAGRSAEKLSIMEKPLQIGIIHWLCYEIQYGPKNLGQSVTNYGMASNTVGRNCNRQCLGLVSGSN